MNQKERYEFIERMFAGLEQVPVDKIIGNYVNLVQRGRHCMGLCPFHRDTKLGSFMVTPDKGIWKCFTCGDEYAGNGIKFVSMYKNLTYLEAAFDVALQMGVISNSDYEVYSRKKYDANYVSKLERRFSDKQKDEPKPIKARPEVIHNVYLMMKEVCPLSDEHRKALENNRKLTKERIEKDYFTFPTHWRQKNRVVAAIKEKFPSITDDVLKTVPGFFYDKKLNKVTFSGYKGLCILIRNAEGRIQAVQIRRDDVKEGDSRYVWLSSTFAFYRPEEFSGGCGCGSPKDVLWAKEQKGIVCITEGRFKSEILVENGNTSISIQGVSSWNGIIDTIKSIQNKQNLKSVFIFLDSDILGKHALFIQSSKMCEAIKQEFPNLNIKYAFWNKSMGKGIDDYINNDGNIKKISYVVYTDAVIIANKAFEQLLTDYGIKRLQDLPQEKVVEFENTLQNRLEEKFVK